MADIMRPIPLKKLITMAMEEYIRSGTIFGIPEKGFYRPEKSNPVSVFSEKTAAPIGPAAGPHTQLAQNILCGYLTGGRFFELKTVQILDRLELQKPCIDAKDEAYNVEWSTELSLEEAFDEYLKAWFLISIFANLFSLNQQSETDFIFNMSVGYDLKGIKSPKVDQFIERMKDASEAPQFQEYQKTTEALLEDAKFWATSSLSPPLKAPKISPHICSQISISTMHGCPPEEIERICGYMITEKKLDTFVKLNPTLMGEAFISEFLESSGYPALEVPKEAFEKDLGLEEAISMLKRLQKLAKDHKRGFGVKLTNTLGVLNHKDVLPGKEMYLSGRPLFPLSINVAASLAQALERPLPMSFSGGITATNIQAVMETGIRPVTICTELLKPGGYLRLRQLVQNGLAARVPEPGEIDLVKLKSLAKDSLGKANPEREKRWRGGPADGLEEALPLTNCFVAPCQEACPLEQDAPAYIRALRAGDSQNALEIILRSNALPTLTSYYCSQKCQKKCLRKDYEGGVAIRELKKQAVDAELKDFNPISSTSVETMPKVAILGLGVPSLGAAHRLLQSGYQPYIFIPSSSAEGVQDQEQYQLPGYSFPMDKVKADVDLLIKMGLQFQMVSEFPEVLALQGQGFSVVLDSRNYLKKTLIDDLAHGRDLFGRPLELLEKKSHEGEGTGAMGTKERDDLWEVKSQMMPQESGNTTGKRCLDCDLVCNKCVDVCPNRSNWSIPIPGEKDRTQIIHLDALCNECGNCSSFCPWRGDPFKDKITVYWSLEDFQDSENPGFFLKIDQLMIRDGKGVWETGITEEGDFIHFSGKDPLMQKVFKELYQHYSFLLEGGQG